MGHFYNRSMLQIVFDNVNKVYANNVHAVVDFNLTVNENEFVVFVGPSGCGKSTTLRMLAGLEEISSGEISIDGVVVNHVEPKDRGIAMVFQNYALYPHMTVRQNMSFALEMKGLSKEEISKRVQQAAEIIGLTEYLDKKPKELSGGQRQRVALGRVIVRQPKVFLMDEPLSNLDAKLRASMRVEITKIHKQVNATTIYVTHDQTEAMTMADRIVVMKDGFVQQIGTPEEVYDNPANLFVATFIGTPAMNVFDAEITADSISFLGVKEKINDGLYESLNALYDRYIAETEQDILELEELIAAHPLKVRHAITRKGKKEEEKRIKNPLTYENQLKTKQEKLKLALAARQSEAKAIKVGIRPSDVIQCDTKRKGFSSPMAFDIEETEYLGHDVLVHLLKDGVRLVASFLAKDFLYGEKGFCFDENALYYFDPISTERISNRKGEEKT
jgi:multiple sugar transport system ATP-binding protein